MVIDSTKCMTGRHALLPASSGIMVPLVIQKLGRQTPDTTSPLGVSFSPAPASTRQAPRVDACPTHATYKADDGSVVIDKSRCIGCGSCIAACPYDARYKNPETGTGG